jgi:hypothetical protein
MVNWFFETFSSSVEQAKLFAIVLSAILAICLLLTNQWFIARKSKKELIISKIEELLTNVYAYERLTLDILSRLFNEGVIDQGTLDKMVESAEVSDKIEMLCALYFSKISFDAEHTQSIVLNVFNQFDAVEMGNDYPKDKYASYQQSCLELKEILTPLKKSLKILMSSHT